MKKNSIKQIKRTICGNHQRECLRLADGQCIGLDIHLVDAVIASSPLRTPLSSPLSRAHRQRDGDLLVGIDLVRADCILLEGGGEAIEGDAVLIAWKIIMDS
jgi:hypothetical protein